MYLNHVPTIATAMQNSPKTFCNAIMFAVVSARTQFVTVPTQMLELELAGRKARCLWSWKTSAFDYLQAHGTELFFDITTTADTTEALLRLTRAVPGLGIVKGAFVLQMLGHDIACLDVRNIVRDGRNPRAYRSDGEAGKATKAYERKVARYVADTSGKAQFYWDIWCRGVAEDYKKTAHQISEMHLCFIEPKQVRKFADQIAEKRAELLKRSAMMPAPF